MTSQNSSALISTVYTSRNIILDLMGKQGYNIEDYGNFSVNEVNSMKQNNQLDMLLEKKEEKSAAADFFEMAEEEINLEEQEKAEAERTAREKKQTIIDRIAAIENEMAITKDNLDTAKEKLAKASDFKVLRTSNEKTEELKKIKQEIVDFEQEL